MSSDLRDRLSRVSARVVVASDAFARFDRRRRRVVRRQRIATGAFALLLAVVVTAGLVSVVRDRAGGVGSEPGTSVGARGHVYRDPLGWQIEVPAGWHQSQLEAVNPHIGLVSEVFSSTNVKPGLDMGGFVKPDLSSLGPADVAVIVSYKGKLVLLSQLESTFPIPWGHGWEVRPGDGPMNRQRDFWWGGLAFNIHVVAGGFDTPPERIEQLKQMLASLQPIDLLQSGSLAHALLGTKWRAIAIDGAAVNSRIRTSPRPSLSFGLHRLGGFDGCNDFGARYRIVGDQLKVAGLYSTLVLCPGVVLQTALVAGGTLALDGDHLTLVSEDHTVTFERFPITPPLCCLTKP